MLNVSNLCFRFRNEFETRYMLNVSNLCIHFRNEFGTRYIFIKSDIFTIRQCNFKIMGTFLKYHSETIIQMISTNVLIVAK